MKQQRLATQQVKYNYGSYNKSDHKEQWIRISEGCPHNCPYCYEPQEIKVFDIPEIIRNDVTIICRELTYSSYGFPTIKPTNIFTNAFDYLPRSLGAYGRGAKNHGVFDNLTKCQRQKLPGSFAREIRQYCESKMGVEA